MTDDPRSAKRRRRSTVGSPNIVIVDPRDPESSAEDGHEQFRFTHHADFWLEDRATSSSCLVSVKVSRGDYSLHLLNQDGAKHGRGTLTRTPEFGREALRNCVDVSHSRTRRTRSTDSARDARAPAPCFVEPEHALTIGGRIYIGNRRRICRHRGVQIGAAVLTKPSQVSKHIVHLSRSDDEPLSTLPRSRPSNRPPTKIVKTHRGHGRGRTRVQRPSSTVHRSPGSTPYLFRKPS